MALYERHPDFSYANPHLARVLPGQTRCASSYIINRKAAFDLLDFQDFVLPIDWHLSLPLKRK